MAIIHANLVPLSILLKEASLKSYAQIATRPTTHPISPLVQQTTNHQIKKHQSSLHHLANMAKFKPEEMEKMNTTRQQPGTMPNFSTFIMETKEKSMENDNKLFPISRMIYTDGSGYKGAIGAVAVAFANSTKIAELQYQLGPDTRHTVFVPFSFRENFCHAILYPVGVFHDMCCTLSVLLLYADGATLCVPYSTLPYSLL